MKRGGMADTMVQSLMIGAAALLLLALWCKVWYGVDIFTALNTGAGVFFDSLKDSLKGLGL